VANGLRPTTERSYRRHLRDHLVPQLGRLRLRDLRPGHVEAMLRTVHAGPSTVRRVHATLRSALSDAKRRRLVSYNAAVDVALPKAARPKVQPWEPAELGRFLDHAAGDRLGVLYEVMAATGLRRGEACGLRWADVDLERGRLVVRQQVVVIGHELRFGPPKTASGDARVIDLDDGTVGALLGHRLAQDGERAEWGQAYADHGLVFARENGEPLHPEPSPSGSGSWPRPRACGPCGCMICGTDRRRSCWPPACRWPWCPSASDTRRSRSPQTRTRTCSRASAERPPSGPPRWCPETGVSSP
jgi:integrase